MPSLYPSTPWECIDPARPRRYKRGVIAAIKAFRASKPWRGTKSARRLKLGVLNASLCATYQISVTLAWRRGLSSCYYQGDQFGNRAIVMQRENPSVISYLHEFAHAILGRSERKAVGWSMELFRRFFPRSAAALVADGHMLRRRRPSERAENLTQSPASGTVDPTRN